MNNTTLRQATSEETLYIQMVHDYLNEKCAFDYANSLGITDWQYCYTCAGQTPTTDNKMCAICHETREDYDEHE